MATARSQPFDLIKVQRRQLESIFSSDDLRDSDVRLLSDDTVSGGSEAVPWKVLILDRDSHDVVACLFSVESLHSMGVTLHLLIGSVRQRVPGISAIYLVAPNQDNVERIAEDVVGGLYDSMYLNFSSAIGSTLLESFTRSLATRGVVPSDDSSTFAVRRVLDHYVNFVSLSPNLFSLNMTESYLALFRTDASEETLNALIDKVVDGLFSVLVSVGKIPVIRAQKGGPSEMVGVKLACRLAQHLQGRGHLFEHCSLSAFEQRPVLILLDRSIDFAQAIHHSPIYWAMLGDLLPFSRHTQFSCDDGSGKQKSVKVDHESDEFWRQNALKPFPTVHEAHTELLQWYSSEMERVSGVSTSSSGGIGDGIVEHTSASEGQKSVIRATLKSMPKYIKRKKEIDKHVTLLRAIGESVKSRAIFDYFHCEDALIHQCALDSDSKELMSSLMDAGSRGTLVDKIRLLLVCYLCQRELDESQMEDLQRVLIEGLAPGSDEHLEEFVSDSSGLLSAVEYLQSHKALTGLGHKLMAEASATSSATATSLTKSGSSLWDLSTKFVGKMTRTVTEMLPMSGKSTVTRIAERTMSPDSLLTAVASSTTHSSDLHKYNFEENYVTFEPKILRAILADKSKSARIAPVLKRCDPREVYRLQHDYDANALDSVIGRVKYKDGIVFVTGGGNHGEFANLLQFAEKYDWNVLYGATEMVTPQSFVKQLSKLGKQSLQ